MAKGQYDHLFEEDERNTPQDAVARPVGNPAGVLDAALDFGVNTLGEGGLTALAGLATGGLATAAGIGAKIKSGRHFLNLPEGIEKMRAAQAFNEARKAKSAAQLNLKTIEANAKALSNKKTPQILTNARREAAAAEDAFRVAQADNLAANQMFQMAKTTGGSVFSRAANMAPYAGIPVGTTGALLTNAALKNRNRVSLDEVDE